MVSHVTVITIYDMALELWMGEPLFSWRSWLLLMQKTAELIDLCFFFSANCFYYLIEIQQDFFKSDLAYFSYFLLRYILDQLLPHRSSFLYRNTFQRRCLYFFVPLLISSFFLNSLHHSLVPTTLLRLSVKVTALLTPIHLSHHLPWGVGFPCYR